MIDKSTVKMKQCQIFTGESVFPVCRLNVWDGRVFSVFVLIYFWADIYLGGDIFWYVLRSPGLFCLLFKCLGNRWRVFSKWEGKPHRCWQTMRALSHTWDKDDHDDPGNIIKMFPFKFAFCQHRGGIDLRHDVSYAYICLFLFAYCIVFLFDIYDNF